MTYNADYSATDFTDIVIDGIGKIAVAVIGFATVIGLILVYRYIKHGKL